MAEVMRLFEFRSIEEAELYPEALLWCSECKTYESNEPDLMAVGIRIPIPWKFNYYEYRYHKFSYRYWHLGLTIILDKLPEKFGRLPIIRFSRYLV